MCPQTLDYTFYFFVLQGIRPEPTDQLVVRKPKAPGRSSVKSTLYRAYAGKY